MYPTDSPRRGMVADEEEMMEMLEMMSTLSSESPSIANHVTKFLFGVENPGWENIFPYSSPEEFLSFLDAIPHMYAVGRMVPKMDAMEAAIRKVPSALRDTSSRVRATFNRNSPMAELGGMSWDEVYKNKMLFRPPTSKDPGGWQFYDRALNTKFQQETGSRLRDYLPDKRVPNAIVDDFLLRNEFPNRLGDIKFPRPDPSIVLLTQDDIVSRGVRELRNAFDENNVPTEQSYTLEETIGNSNGGLIANETEMMQLLDLLQELSNSSNRR